MTPEKLKEKGGLYFGNIEEGFREFYWREEKMDAHAAEKAVKDRMEASGTDQDTAYADFYYFTLPEEAKEKAGAVLNEAERQYLAELEKTADGIIFPLTEKLLPILAKLNETEMLFSTFYFTRPAETWWGNYGGTYVIFKQQAEK